MKLVAGNWKMNGDRAMARSLLADLAARQQQSPAACAVAVCPPAHLLPPVVEAAAGRRILVGAQDCSAEAGPGAFTGEISAAMLRATGCDYVIVGHSERRARHGESDALVRAKAGRALDAGLIPIICVGETLAEREAGRAVEVVRRQVAGSLPEAARLQLVVVAYEPVWAIGTGKTATPDDVRAMHAEIRAQLAGLGPQVPPVPLLHGGSVKPDNAAELMAQPNVDGALVGGASLKAADFWAIVQACR
jgi:triosephosphate isomerase